MDKKVQQIVLVLMVTCIVGMSCGRRTISQSIPADDADKLSFAPAWAALYMQKASEYKALTLQAYNIAYDRLDAYLQQPGTKPFAVITDIDETVLDNSPYTVHQAFKGASYSDSSWKVWTALADCDTVPGAPAFFKYAASRKVEVFYISNRLQAEMAPTIANLKRYGFPNADETHVLLKTNGSGKDARRAQVSAKYDVLLYFGDNLGDFSGVFDHKANDERDALVKEHVSDFGKRFIVLPNAMYGEWQGALIHYNYQLSKKDQADSIIHSLRNY